MWDYEEGSIFDPLAFQPKPKKPENQLLRKREQYRPSAYQRPAAPIEWRKLNPSKYVKGGLGLLQTYKKITSPSYQLKKANRQLKDIETNKKLMEVRKELAEEKRIISEQQKEQRSRTISKIKERLGIREPLYGSNQRLPRSDIQDRLDETKERYTGKMRDRYLSDKEKYEKK